MTIPRPFVLGFFVFGLSGSVLAAPSSSAKNSDPALTANSVALAVGVGQYRNSALDLRYASRDASEVAALLASRGFGTRLMTDERATAAIFLHELAHLAFSTGTVVVYFSGHGIATAAGPALLLSDADPADPSTYVMWQDVVRSLIGSKARDIFVILDACQTSLSPEPPTFTVDPSLFNGRLHVLSATTPNGASYEYDELGHGVFTHFLLQGMRGAAADGSGTLSFNRLATYVRTSVTEYSLQRGNLQVPQYLSSKDHVLWSASPDTKTPTVPRTAPTTSAEAQAPVSEDAPENLVFGAFTWAEAEAANVAREIDISSVYPWPAVSTRPFAGWYQGDASAHPGYDLSGVRHVHIATHGYLDFNGDGAADDRTATRLLGAPLLNSPWSNGADADGLVTVDQALRSLALIYDNSVIALAMRNAVRPERDLTGTRYWFTPGRTGRNAQPLAYVDDLRTRYYQPVIGRYVNVHRIFNPEAWGAVDGSGSRPNLSDAGRTVWIFARRLDSTAWESPHLMADQKHRDAPMPWRLIADTTSSAGRPHTANARPQEEQAALIATRAAVQMLDLGVQMDDPRYFALLCTTYPQSNQCAEANWYMQDRSTVGYPRGLARSTAPAPAVPGNTRDEHTIQFLIALCAALSGALTTVMVSYHQHYLHRKETLPQRPLVTLK